MADTTNRRIPQKLPESPVSIRNVRWFFKGNQLHHGPAAGTPGEWSILDGVETITFQMGDAKKNFLPCMKFLNSQAPDRVKPRMKVCVSLDNMDLSCMTPAFRTAWTAKPLDKRTYKACAGPPSPLD